MITIPNAVFTKFIAHINKAGVSAAYYTEYKKWLRYYLDFCDKYPVPEAKSERVSLFIDKLRDKKQSLAQRQRAAHAVSLYFEMQKHEVRSPGKGNESSTSQCGEGLHPLRTGQDSERAEKPAGFLNQRVVKAIFLQAQPGCRRHRPS